MLETRWQACFLPFHAQSLPSPHALQPRSCLTAPGNVRALYFFHRILRPFIFLLLRHIYMRTHGYRARALGEHQGKPSCPCLGGVRGHPTTRWYLPRGQRRGRKNPKKKTKETKTSITTHNRAFPPLLPQPRSRCAGLQRGRNSSLQPSLLLVHFLSTYLHT